MRQDAGSPQISIDASETSNWLWYCSPAWRDEDFQPAAHRPAPDATAAAQWRAWQEQLWGRVRRDPSRFGLGAVPSWIDDPPRFGSLARWPAFRAWCQAAWPAFPGWFDMARPATSALISAAHVHRSSMQAIQMMAPGQQVRIDVVALAAERVLIEEPDRAVIAAGLLRADDRFGSWVTAFVTRNAV